MIEKNEELTKLLSDCIKDKKLLEKEQEEIHYGIFEPRCQIMYKILQKERENNRSLNNEQFLILIIEKYFFPTIDKIIGEYGHLITEEKLEKLKGLKNRENFKITDINSDKHDISANSEKGKIIIHVNNNKELNLRKIVNILGTLPHEAFHFIYQFLKHENDEHARYFYEFENGERLHFGPGKVGTILAEGFVEKKSSEFCERHGIFYTINPHYTPYVKVCAYFEEKLGLTDYDLLTNNYDNILSQLSEEALKDYLNYEGITVLQNNTPKEYKEKEERKEPIPEIDFSKIKRVYVEELSLEKRKTM